MADTIRELLVRLGVDADDAHLQRFDRALGDVKQRMMVAGAAAAALTAGMGKLIYDFATGADEVAKTARRLGIGVEQLQELQYGAQRTGVPVNTLNMAIQRMTRRMSEAASGTGEAKDAIRELGLDASELSKLQPDQVLMRVADAMDQVDTESDKLRLSFKLFDSEGVAVVNMLRGGSEQLQKYRDRAREVGYVISQQATKDAEEFADQLLDTKGVLLGIRNTIGAGLLPDINQLLRRFRDWYIANKEVLAQRMEEWADRLGDSLNRLADTAGKIDQVTQALGGWYNVMVAITSLLGAAGGAWFLTPFVKLLRALIPLLGTAGAGGATTAFGVSLGALAGWAALAVLALVQLAAEAAALYLMFEDLYVLFRGGKSAIGEWIAAHQSADGVIGSLARSLESWLTILRSVFLLVREGHAMMGEFANQAVEAFNRWEIAGVNVSDKLRSAFEAVGHALSSVVLAPFESIEMTLQRIEILLDRIGAPGIQAPLYDPATAGAAPGSRNVTVGDTTINVSPGEGMDEQRIADIVAQRQEELLRGAIQAGVPGSER